MLYTKDHYTITVINGDKDIYCERIFVDESQLGGTLYLPEGVTLNTDENIDILIKSNSGSVLFNKAKVCRYNKYTGNVYTFSVNRVVIQN